MKRHNLQNIKLYAPTSSDEKELIKEFYNNRSQMLTRKTYFNYIIGDFNAEREMKGEKD